MKEKNKKTVEDIDLTKVDISKHTFILKADTVLSRVIIGNYDPKIPTGQAHRYAKNPNNASIATYQNEFLSGNGVQCSTGSTCVAVLLTTALMEAHKRTGTLKSAIAHKIKVLKDVTCIDTISICLSENADPTPNKDANFWHSFYGPPIKAQALRCKSAEDPKGENIILFPDNIPDYLKVISSEEYPTNEVESAKRKIVNNNDT
ncbi:MAG: hypothetical protein ABII88_10975 [Candidatus Omnitrophota bacterium]